MCSLLGQHCSIHHEAVPHAAIPDSTNHFSLVNTLGESELDSACSIKGFQLFGGEFQIQTGEIVLELRCLPRSHDRDYWHCLLPQPRECDLRHAATSLFGDRLHRRDDPWALQVLQQCSTSACAERKSIGWNPASVT